jgi:L,D-peptidoglycan transpeptidase YkuD (ErfK/YbiS/YcfS/YnhG family)
VEIMSLLNDTIAKLNINQNQMKLVVSPNSTTNATNNPKGSSGIFLKDQQQFPTKLGKQGGPQLLGGAKP